MGISIIMNSIYLVFGASSQDLYVYMGCILLIFALLFTRFTAKKVRRYIRWRSIKKIRARRASTLHEPIRDYAGLSPA